MNQASFTLFAFVTGWQCYVANVNREMTKLWQLPQQTTTRLFSATTTWKQINTHAELRNFRPLSAPFVDHIYQMKMYAHTSPHNCFANMTAYIWKYVRHMQHVVVAALGERKSSVSCPQQGRRTAVAAATGQQAASVCNCITGPAM